MRWFFFNTVVAVLATSPSEPEFDTYSRVTSCPLPKSSHIAAAKSAFTLANLIPDLVPVFDPSTVVQASYNGKDVDLGNNFSTTGTVAIFTNVICKKVNIRQRHFFNPTSPSQLSQNMTRQRQIILFSSWTQMHQAQHFLYLALSCT